MPSYQGLLYSILGNLKTKSEGPQYFLQGPGNEGVAIAKQSQPFLPDNNLHGLRGRKVRVEGTLDAGAIRYTQVELLFPAASSDPPWDMGAALAVAGAPVDGTGAPVTLGPGDISADVLRLQKRLVDLGFPNVPTDGFYGTGMVEAVRAFQQANGIPDTGISDANTQRILFL